MRVSNCPTLSLSHVFNCPVSNCPVSNFLHWYISMYTVYSCQTFNDTRDLQNRSKDAGGCFHCEIFLPGICALYIYNIIYCLVRVRIICPISTGLDLLIAQALPGICPQVHIVPASMTLFCHWHFLSPLWPLH